MGGRGSSGSRNVDVALEEAIKAYTAKGGEYASQYPFTKEKEKILLDAMSAKEYTTKTDIYRKIDLSQADYEKFFNTLYEKGSKDIDFDTLQSFTQERTRAFSYGGTQQQYILYKIPKGTKIHGDDIADRSIYSVEKEVLLGKNQFRASYKDLNWTSSGNMIVTLRRRKR